jgi:uncharacterized protein YfaS (alpha-2-macroglobulin family)
LYVSSLAGKPNRPALLQWKTQPEKLDQEGRYMVACALLAAGDAEGFNQLMPNQWKTTLELLGPEKKPGQFQNDLISSEVAKTSSQEEAFVLCAMASAWPEHQITKYLATRLKNKISLQSENLSTQEGGMALVGLAKLAKRSENKSTLFEAKLGSKKLIDGKADKINLNSWNELLSLKNSNKKGQLFYWIDAQGLSNTGNLPEEDFGIEIRKSFYNLNGQSINPKNLKINDLVVVRLSLISKTGASIPNIALVDIVPSCLRIENKRIGQNSDYKTVTTSSEPEYYDIRQDRINIFCSASVKEKSFYYSARVVAKGTYTWGPSEAHSMYLSSIFSRSGGTKIEISDKAGKEIGKELSQNLANP